MHTCVTLNREETVFSTFADKLTEEWKNWDMFWWIEVNVHVLKRDEGDGPGLCMFYIYK